MDDVAAKKYGFTSWLVPTHRGELNEPWEMRKGKEGETKFEMEHRIHRVRPLQAVLIFFPLPGKILDLWVLYVDLPAIPLLPRLHCPVFPDHLQGSRGFMSFSDESRLRFRFLH
ncbi:hypothetical protein M413DRAFT_446157 [Hebeloma cylindrosporum]|uniref:Uncharacterized protein n=1 Tax=Hebeloma cylindrosporum TaxID=76867 RepID=A0A0C3CB01_HEBCY|nr:hypothetical protein M413DRAFT_446157 [Hebeloma cylindrosporum h7]